MNEASKSKFDNIMEGIGFFFWIVGGVGIVGMNIYTVIHMIYSMFNH